MECDEIVKSVVSSSWKSIPTVLSKKTSKSSKKSSTVPAKYPTRLALPKDSQELNSLHCFVRAELLELFVVPFPQEDNNKVRNGNVLRTHSRRRRRSCTRFKGSASQIFDDDDEEEEEEEGNESEYEDTPAERRQDQIKVKKTSSSFGHLTSSSVRLFPGRVGLRCVHCYNLSQLKQSSEYCETSSKASMSLFYPKSLNDLYRSVCTWQRVHFRNCQHIPKDVRKRYWALKDGDRSRGKTKYWIVSAKKLGLVDTMGLQNRGGIQFSSK